MNKLMLASITALLAGATALPALADDRGRRAGGEASWQQVQTKPARAEHRERREDRRDDRQDDRRDRRDDRRDDRQDWRADRRDDRRDWRDDRRDDRRDWRDDRRDDRRDWRHDRRDHYARHNDRRWNGYHWQPAYRYRAPVRYVYPPGYRAYRWQVGHRLPPSYYHRNYYVDYRAYRLPPPPYGYHWVRVDRDVVLVALASGLIRDVLYGLYY